MVSQLTLHVVGSEFSGRNLSFLVDNSSFALSTIIAPLSIVDLLLRSDVHATAPRSLAFVIITDVDVASSSVNEAALSVLPVVLPAAFVDGAVEEDQFALAFLAKHLVLSVVKVSVGVQQLADR